VLDGATAAVWLSPSGLVLSQWMSCTAMSLLSVFLLVVSGLHSIAARWKRPHR